TTSRFVAPDIGITLWISPHPLEPVCEATVRQEAGLQQARPGFAQKRPSGTAQGACAPRLRHVEHLRYEHAAKYRFSPAKMFVMQHSEGFVGFCADAR